MQKFQTNLGRETSETREKIPKNIKTERKKKPTQKDGRIQSEEFMCLFLSRRRDRARSAGLRAGKVLNGYRKAMRRGQSRLRQMITLE